MKHLPVPPLEQTLDRYVEALTPLLDASALAASRAAVGEFAAGDGPACQRALVEFARVEDAAGRNWMSQAWLAGYFEGRGPLSLVSSPTFQLRWESPYQGVPLAADVVHRFAEVHLARLRGELAADVSGRGDPVCMQQWAFLAGGLRDPRPGADVFLPGRSGADRRHVVVLHRGHGAAVEVSGADGAVLSRVAIEQALREITRQGPFAQATFTLPGYLGGDRSAAMLAQLRADPGNAAVLDLLREALFVVNLVDEPLGDEAHMERGAFAVGQAWPYKPVNLQISLARDAFVGLHMEHSTIDGATIATIIGLAQRAAVGPAGGAEHPAPWWPIGWNLTPEEQEALAGQREAYAQASGGLRFRVVTVPTPPVPPVPFRVSLDGVQQVILQYAQLATYGRLRSTYESVDMREYQAGRTECLRPNTPAALTFTRALVEGRGTPQLLAEALQAHRDQVKACKSGQGIDRHLFGLRLMADRHGYRAPLFRDPGYSALTTDFLSTTSLGERSRIMRAAFAPTSDGGIGVYYSASPEDVEFCLNYDDRRTERIDEFVQALHEGTRAVWAALQDC